MIDDETYHAYDIEEQVWSACDTAIDFPARIRFLRADAESPRHLRSCVVSPRPLFPQESSSCPPINS